MMTTTKKIEATFKPTHNVVFKKDTHFKQIGVAWESRVGNRIRVVIDSIPLNFTGELFLLKREDSNHVQ